MSNELDRTLELWRLIQHRVPIAITNSATYLDGYPAGSDGPGGISTESGGRTQSIALRHVDTGDRHGDLHRRIARTINELANLCDQLAPSNKALDHMASMAHDQGCPPGCCESCFRDHGYREPARTVGSTLCKFCQDWARDLDTAAPPLFFVEKRHRGQRISERDVNTAKRGKP